MVRMLKIAVVAAPQRQQQAEQAEGY
jgi:hypothetical protein